MPHSGDAHGRPSPTPPVAPREQKLAASPSDTAGLEPAVEILRPLLRDPGQAQQVVAKVATAVLFRGPLPPPEVFKDYEDVVPGSAREILNMATREQGHRHRLQLLEMIYPYLGQCAGFVGFLSSVGGAVYLAMNDRPAVAGLILGVPCLGVIGWLLILGSPREVLRPHPPSQRNHPAGVDDCRLTHYRVPGLAGAGLTG